MKNIIIVNNPKSWEQSLDDVDVVAAKAYLTDATYNTFTGARIYNLCRSYRYQSIGYYVSLLAEARGHRVFPDITTIQDFRSQAIARIVSEDIDSLIQTKLRKLKSREFILSIYFGKNLSPQYDPLAKKLHSLFPAPLLRAHFVNQKRWMLQSISPLTLRDIPDSHKPYLYQFAGENLAKKHQSPRRKAQTIYDLAILQNPEEDHGPSNRKAIQRFIQAAESLGFYTSLITKEDYASIAEYDALFIRETTAVNHHTYRMSRRAHAEGLVVVDDPVSILKCTNKVYLAELLTQAKIPAPKTMVVHKDNIKDVERQLGLPCVLKKPDSSFSQGVVRVDDREKVRSEIEKFLDSSELILAQEYTPTQFDWRIGVLDRKALFACKYYMMEGHWQIYDWQQAKGGEGGDTETLPIEKVPEPVVKLALRAANLIGDGLYGVDIKQTNGHLYVIEVNDNPSIDAGIEDEHLGKELYLTLARFFWHRLEARRRIIKEPRS